MTAPVLSPEAMLDAFKACLCEAGYSDMADWAYWSPVYEMPNVRPASFWRLAMPAEKRSRTLVLIRAMEVVCGDLRGVPAPTWCAACCLANRSHQACQHEDGKSWDAWRAELLGDTA